LAIGVLVAESLHMLLSGWFDAMLPYALLEIKHSQHQGLQAPQLYLLIGVIALAVLVCMFLGLVGVALYQWWGRTLYTLFWLADLLLMPLLSPQIHAPLEVAISEATLLAAGALLALVWLSPARELFARNAHSKTQLAGLLAKPSPPPRFVWMIVGGLVTVAVALSLVPPADPNPAFDLWWPSRAMTTAGVACKSLDDLERIYKLKSQGADAAVARTVKAAESDGRCRTIPAGTKVLLVDIAKHNSVVQIRLSGIVTRYWVAIETFIPLPAV
jgi:hypothetical protein